MDMQASSPKKSYIYSSGEGAKYLRARVVINETEGTACGVTVIEIVEKGELVDIRDGETLVVEFSELIPEG
jgi:hypothetical protein